jgi:hypothetical protein
MIGRFVSHVEVEGISLPVLHFNVTNYRFVFPLILLQLGVTGDSNVVNEMLR